jgi:dTDP-4-dehydrorhamnose reductase
MNVLITGANGQLGKEILNLAAHFPKLRLIETDKKSLDICNSISVKHFIQQHNIAVVINCAAYTQVDAAETNENAAYAINHLAVENLAKLAKELQFKLIHISTDYVFDGTASNPYVEKHPVNPQNIYGKSKLLGEQAILNINPANTVIIRTSWLYSQFGSNFVKTIYRLSAQKETLNVVSDQIGSPTYAANLAQTILQIIPKINQHYASIYHFANQGSCSWFQLAQEIVALSNHRCLVVPITSENYPTVAKRPQYSVLACDKIKNDFNLTIPQWQEALKVCISKIKQLNNHNSANS